MTTKHTPGPWVADESGNVFGPGGRIVASCYGVAGARAENMANAAMVAAALDLAGALESMVERYDQSICTHKSARRERTIWTVCYECGEQWADDDGGVPEYVEPPDITKARAALAKARGEE